MFVGGDRFHDAHGNVELSSLLMGARLAGVVAILAAIVASSSRHARAVAVLNGLCLVLYGCALTTVLAVGLRNSFFYFSSLPLVVLLMFGPLRLLSRSVVVLLTIELALIYLVLDNGTRLLMSVGLGDAKGSAIW